MWDDMLRTVPASLIEGIFLILSKPFLLHCNIFLLYKIGHLRNKTHNSPDLCSKLICYWHKFVYSDLDKQKPIVMASNAVKITRCDTGHNIL